MAVARTIVYGYGMVVDGIAAGLSLNWFIFIWEDSNLKLLPLNDPQLFQL